MTDWTKTVWQGKNQSKKHLITQYAAENDWYYAQPERHAYLMAMDTPDLKIMVQMTASEHPIIIVYQKVM